MKKTTVWIVCLFCLVVAVLYTFASVRPQLNVIASTNQESNVIDMTLGEKRIPLTKRSLPNDTTLEISLEQLAEGPLQRTLGFETPTTLSGGFLNNSLLKMSGQWEKNEIYPYLYHFKTNDVNAKLHWEGYVSGVHIPLQKSSTAGIAKISWNGEVHRVDLYNEVASTEVVTLRNNKILFYTTVPLFASTFNVDWAGSDVNVHTISIVLGGKIIFEEHLEDFSGDSYFVNLPNRLIQSVSLYVLKNIAIALSVCFYLTVIYFIIVFPFIFLLTTKTS